MFKLAQYAQEWANYLAKNEKFEHRKERKYGENLYTFQSSDPQRIATASEACKSWYDEIQKYNFDSEDSSLSSGTIVRLFN